MLVCVGSINYGVPRSAVVTSCSYNSAVSGDSIGTAPQALGLREECSPGGQAVTGRCARADSGRCTAESLNALVAERVHRSGKKIN